MSRASVIPFAGAHSGTSCGLPGQCVTDARPVTVDPDGQASIWYERTGSTVTPDRGGVKMPTVRAVNAVFVIDQRSSGCCGTRATNAGAGGLSRATRPQD